MLRTRYASVKEFDEWVQRPENAERHFEFIGGEIVEVVSNNYSSEIALFIGAKLSLFVREHGLGRVTGADGGYMVLGERYIPDVGFISKAKQPKPSREAYNPNPPDLAVEVLSPSNKEADMSFKVVNYTLAGTVVWLVDPDRQMVEVYVPGQPPVKVAGDGVLDGGAILPGFSLVVSDLFQDE